MTKPTTDSARSALHIERDSQDRSLAWREQLAINQAIMQQTVDGIVVTDSAGIIVDCNPATLRMLGYRRDEVIGRSVTLFMPEPHRGRHEDYMRTYLETGQARIIGKGREIEALHKEGHRVWVRLTIGEIKISSFHGFVGSLHNISMRRQLDQERGAYALKLSHQVEARTVELNRRVIELRAINDLLACLHEVDSEKKILDHILDCLAKLPWVDAQAPRAVFLSGPNDAVLHLAAQQNMDEARREHCRQVELSACLCGQAAQSGELRHSADARCEQHLDPSGQPSQSDYAIPIMHGAKVIGVINVALSGGLCASPDEVQLLHSIAEICAGALLSLRATAAAQRSEQNLRMVAAQTPALIWTTDRDLVITHLFGAGIRAFGIPVERVLGTSLRNIKAFAGIEKILRAHEQAMHQGQSRYEVVFRGHTVDAHIEALRVEDGQVTGCIGVAHDVSDRKLAEEARAQAAQAEARAQAAEQTAHARAMFLSSMSHELRTPLNSVVGFARLLQPQIESLGPGPRRQIDNIVQAGEHMASLVNDLLDLRRLQDTEHTQTLQAVHLRTCVDESLTLVRGLLQDRSESVVVEIADPGVRVCADRRSLIQVLTNLLSNAAKYTPVSAGIWLRAEVQDEWVRIEVSDAGPGIAAEDLPQLFDYWRQAGGKHEHHMKGSGIGLALTQELVEVMGGKIEVRSQVGQGTTFCVRLRWADGGVEAAVSREGRPGEAA